jgi:hypothetical protein
VYLFGKRYCSKCNTSLISESKGVVFNEVGILYFDLKDSENLCRAAKHFSDSNYVKSFKELQKEKNLAQIVKLYKENSSWIQECLIRVTAKNQSYVSSVIDLSNRIFSREESKKLQIKIYDNLLKKAKDEGNAKSENKYYHYLYRLTKKEDYKKKLKAQFYRSKEKRRKLLFFAASKLIIYGFISACLFDLLFIFSFGYKFPLKYSGPKLSIFTGFSVWRFIPLFLFIGLVISTSYWFAFSRYFSNKSRKKLKTSLILMTISFLMAGVCYADFEKYTEGISLAIYILAILSFVIFHNKAIEDLLDSTWKKILWPFLTLFLLFLATIPGRVAMPLFHQSSPVDFVGISFFSFSFILLQATFLILFNRNISPAPRSFKGGVLTKFKS